MKRIYISAGLVFMMATQAFSALAADEKDYVQVSNLPALYIETANQEKIPSKNEDYLRATLHWVEGDNITVYEELGIRGRGNSTWNFEKKPYRIKFDSKQTFLGPERANAKSWTLLANHADKTLMRNAVASAIGTFAGQPFTAAAEFVDLFLNGEYLGNYQISDQMEVRKKRVEITEQDAVVDGNANITGGYFLEVDGFAMNEPVYIITNKGIKITIKSPDEDVISDAQVSYIYNYINKFENALFSADFADPQKGYRQYVDESTLASWYISSELTGNVDCFWSTYIYKDKDDPKIYWGPLWDFDIAFNNCTRSGEVTNALMTEKGFGSDLTKIWITRMWQDPWFANMINKRWKELVEAGIEQYVLNYIDDTAALLEESQRLNYKKWPIYSRVYEEIMLFSTYREGVDYLKEFISRHITYLTIAFENAANGQTAPEPFEPHPDYYYTISNRSVGSLVDVDADGGVCIWNQTEGRLSQNWRFVAGNNGYYQIINRENDLAITDMTELWGSSYIIGSQYVMSEPDITDKRQLWEIFPAGESNGMGHIISNAQTGMAWNNSEGAYDNGNPVVSWYNDDDNLYMPARQWYIKRIEENMDGIKDPSVNDVEYYISYEPQAQLLHFRAAGDESLDGRAAIYSIDGKLFMQFSIAEDVDISSLMRGNYILSWTTGAKTRTLKFAK